MTGTIARVSPPFSNLCRIERSVSPRVHARHTTLTNVNSDVDLSVPSVWLVQHATATQTGDFSVWSVTPFFGLQLFLPTTMLYPSDFYLPASFSSFPEYGVAAHLGLVHLPEPAVPLTLGWGLTLLAWLDHRRRRRAG